MDNGGYVTDIDFACLSHETRIPNDWIPERYRTPRQGPTITINIQVQQSQAEIDDLRKKIESLVESYRLQRGE